MCQTLLRKKMKEEERWLLFEHFLKEDSDMSDVVFEIFKDRIEADKKEAVKEAVDATTHATQEDIAKKMIEDKKPFDEIFKYTLVPIERLNELAKMLSGTPVRG